MGYGMCLNLLKNKYKVNIVTHKNRKPIDKLIKKGAFESSNNKELVKVSEVLIICVTNTFVANNIINKIAPFIKKKSFVIDMTTHNRKGSIKIFKKL